MVILALSRLERYQSRLEAYYLAELAVLDGKRYKIGSRELERADLDDIQKNIKYLEDMIDELESNSSGKRKAYRITLRDV